MKKLFLLMFLTILLVGTVSALEFDNILKYSEDDMKVELINWFGLGVDYGSAELKSHNSVTEVKEVCLNSEVEGEVNFCAVSMYYDFDFKELYKDGLGNVEFINMNGKEEVERNWRYVYWGEEEYEVPTYSCNKIIASNGTQIEDCQKIGTETKIREKWLPYKSSDIPSKNIRIGIEVQVKKGDKIDGIWNIGGKRIEKHAEWTESLTVDLEFYYAMEDNAATTFVTDTATNYNGIASVNTNNLATINGIVGNGFDLVVTEDIDTGFQIADLSTAKTVNFWINTTDSDFAIFSRYDGTRVFYTILNSDNSLTWWIKSTGTANIKTGTAIGLNDGNLHMVTLTQTGATTAHMEIAIDNVEVATTNDSAELLLSASLNADITINSNGGGTKGIARYDEFSYWSRALDATERGYLWNGGNGITYTISTPDLLVSLVSPTNATTFSTYSPTLITNVSTSEASLGVSNSTIKIWNVNATLMFNQGNSSGLFTNYTWNPTLPSGSYNWSAYALGNDSIQYNTTIPRFFTIDTTPIISVSSPINDTYLTGSIWFNSTSNKTIDEWK